MPLRSTRRLYGAEGRWPLPARRIPHIGRRVPMPSAQSSPMWATAPRSWPIRRAARVRQPGYPAAGAAPSVACPGAVPTIAAMPAPPTGNREFRNDAIRLAELTVNIANLENLTFQNCRILGPAVLIPQGSSFMHCGFDTPNVDAIFWEIAESREFVIGGVGAVNCTFSSCTFSMVGLAGRADLRAMLETAING